MKKGDYIVIMVIIVFSVSLFAIMNKKGLNNDDKNNLYVVISVNGKEYKKVKLYGTNEIININTKYGDNTLEIKDGKVNMIYSNCKEQICVKHHKISVSGENIICLPNRVVVSIESEKNNEVDVVLH